MAAPLKGGFCRCRKSVSVLIRAGLGLTAASHPAEAQCNDWVVDLGKKNSPETFQTSSNFPRVLKPAFFIHWLIKRVTNKQLTDRLHLYAAVTPTETPLHLNKSSPPLSPVIQVSVPGKKMQIDKNCKWQKCTVSS